MVCEISGFSIDKLAFQIQRAFSNVAFVSDEMMRRSNTRRRLSRGRD
jgi:hypothetical protein